MSSPDIVETTVAETIPSRVHEELWTPVVKAQARLARVASEEPGSMHHFATALLVSDVVLKLHALALVSMLDKPSRSRVSFELARAEGSGTWINAAYDAAARLNLSGLRSAGPEEAEWLLSFRTWLTRRKRRTDATSIQAVLKPLGELSHDLAAQSSLDLENYTPLSLMQLAVEVRNKTTGHHAYGAEFWAANVSTVTQSVQWLIENSPLWETDLVMALQRAGKPLGRKLRGSEPSGTSALDQDLEEGRIALVLNDKTLTALVPLIHVDAATNLTYFANGAWRDSDSSLEFLCHSIAATAPGSGSQRRELTRYSIRPAPLPPSETEGGDELVLDPGVVANNLPAAPDGYVSRPELESELLRYLRDEKRRHLINVRGTGGFGKTSLVLHLCTQLALNPDDCPYSAVVWMSARDVDLTLQGATSVRRGSEGLEDVWKRFSKLLGEDDPDRTREVFEAAMQDDGILLILDNFETFDDQETAFQYLDEVVHPPSKAIVTSRHTLRGDYSVEVKGMSFDEASQLLVRAARDANTEPLMTQEVRERIFERSQGHPYAMKLIASQVRSQGGLSDQMTKVVRQDDLLDALFRRSIQDLGSDEDAVFLFLLIGQFAAGLVEPVARIAADSLQLNLDAALRELQRRSLIEIDRQAPHIRYDMPAMAREFAQRHLAGHILQTEVEAWVRFVKQWPPLLGGRLREGSEQILRAVQDGRLRGPEIERALGGLSSLAAFDDQVWPLLARAQLFAEKDESVWSESYKRAIEHDPGRADLLWEWSEATSSPERKIDLKVQAVFATRSRQTSFSMTARS